MSIDKKNSIQKIAFVNFGGIGDEVLFTPVINEVHQYMPDAHLTLIVEDRAGNIKHLLPHVNSVIDVRVQGVSRISLFFKLLGILRSKYFDAVIASGSSPFIPLLLFLSGIPHRVGFRTGPVSKLLLSAEAPLDKKAYAADMYFKLGRVFLDRFLPVSEKYLAPQHVAPKLANLPDDDTQWARSLLSRQGLKKILIHPGVSLVSVQKNILKSWPATHWAELIQKLSKKHRVYLIGGPDDARIISDIEQHLPESVENFSNLYGQTKNLQQMAALIQQADLLISVASAPMHFAVGYQTPVVAMFGPTDSTKLLPNSPDYRAVVLENLDCRPCLWDVRKTSCNTPVCLEVPVGKMLQAVAEVFRVSDNEPEEEISEVNS